MIAERDPWQSSPSEVSDLDLTRDQQETLTLNKNKYFGIRQPQPRAIVADGYLRGYGVFNCFGAPMAKCGILVPTYEPWQHLLVAI